MYGERISISIIRFAQFYSSSENDAAWKIMPVNPFNNLGYELFGGYHIFDGERAMI